MTDVTDLLEKVLDAGANNIWSELRNIKGASSEEIEVASRRWVWELVQNASDCANKELGVNINFDFDGEILKFSHDGEVFIYKNLLDLITQISSKQSSDEEKTGKFGTGFISTHLLSPTINLKSYFRNNNNNYMPFEMLLDRSGETYDEIKRNIQKELEYVEQIKEKSNEIRYSEAEGNFETCFEYNVSHSIGSKEAVEKGIHNLLLTLPYLLTFNKKINSISINGLKYWIEEELVNENTRKVTVSNLNEEKTVVMVFKTNNTEVAFNISLENSNEIIELNPRIAKIFCDFPLVGTEKFSFPLIINNPTLDVLKDRDGIHEGAINNIQILEEAKSLYENILNYVSGNHFKRLHNLCIVPAFNKTELNVKLLEQVTSIYSKIPLVETNINGVYIGLRPITGEEKDNYISIPFHSSEDLRDEMWHIVNSMLKMPIPTLETYKNWINIIPINRDITDINYHILKINESLDKLIEIYQKDEQEIIDWLNLFYELWKKTFLGKESINEVYILNQNLKFKPAKELNKDRGIIEEFKQVLTELGKDIRNELVNTNLIIADEIIDEYLEDKDIIKKIERKVDLILSDEAGLNNTKNRDGNIQRAFNTLADWFLQNPDRGKELSEKLFKNRPLLSSLEQTITRFKIAEKVESNKIDIDDLDTIFSNHKKIEEILIALGNEQNTNILTEFKHRSIHNIDYYLYFKEKYDRSTERVYEYLKSNRKYEVPENLEEWKKSRHSRTVFPAKKDNVYINIIIRPSDGDKIIIHEDAELAVLDSRLYELWTDNGIDQPKDITLGDILKTTGINVIPLRKIY